MEAENITFQNQTIIINKTVIIKNMETTLLLAAL